MPQVVAVSTFEHLVEAVDDIHRGQVAGLIKVVEMLVAFGFDVQGRIMRAPLSSGSVTSSAR